MNTTESTTTGPLCYKTETLPDGTRVAKFVEYSTRALPTEIPNDHLPLHDNNCEQAWEITDLAIRVAGVDGPWLIARERQRQFLTKGFDDANDDDFLEGELVAAGRSYALYAEMQAIRKVSPVPADFFPKTWPWMRKWWKPSPDPVVNLIKAGALIAAEIDRHLRARKKLTDEIINS
jgi:hypothetical protein